MVRRRVQREHGLGPLQSRVVTPVSEPHSSSGRPSPAVRVADPDTKWGTVQSRRAWGTVQGEMGDQSMDKWGLV